MLFYLSLCTFLGINLVYIIKKFFNKTVFILSLAISFWIISLPTYSWIGEGEIGAIILRNLSEVLLSLLNIAKFFVLGLDIRELLGKFPISYNINYLYFWIVILYTLASATTLTVVLSYFSQFITILKIRYFHTSSNHIFLGLSDNNLKVANQLNKLTPKAKIIFTPIAGESISVQPFLKYENNISSLLKQLSNAEQNNYYILNKDVSSIESAIDLLKIYGNKITNDYVYVQDSSKVLEMYLQKQKREDSQLKVRLINSPRTTIYNYFFEHSKYLTRLFKNKGKIIIIGDNEISKEAIKLLLWLAQIVRYELDLLLITSSSKLEEDLKYDMPTLFDNIQYETPHYFEFKVLPELTPSFINSYLKEFQSFNYVFLMLDDFTNLEMVNYLQRNFDFSFGFSFTLSSPSLYDLNSLEYNDNLIDYYPFSVHFNSELEKKALNLHQKFQNQFVEKNFFNNQYNYFSSMARALGEKYGEKKRNDYDNLEKEHNRWSMFLKTEGWRYNSTKSNSMKHHHLLIPFEQLPEQEKSKDLN
ncbi:hypothetical protein GOM48_05355 [Streptococcus oralis]|uniref:RyR domain-containing protein n=1 Tax=Streptococcus oralis TaxID=1303 RepID=UPI001EEE6335|nr:RyR domain-containing protein [Streptococcus oralis]UJD00367.1 hypothetical protein GOM48_05355 [Streptococcus oralis]